MRVNKMIPKILKAILKGLSIRSDPPKYTNKNVPGIIPIKVPIVYVRRETGVTPSKKLITLKGNKGTKRKKRIVLKPRVLNLVIYFSTDGYFDTSFFV